MQKLLEILALDFPLRNSLWSSLLIGLVVPVVGVYLVIGRKAILALMLPPISTLGVAVTLMMGTLLGVDFAVHEHASAFLAAALCGAFITMGGALLWQELLRRNVDTPGDSDSGTMYACATAAILVLAASRFVPELGLLDVLRGESLAVPDHLLIAEAVVLGIVVAVLGAMRHPFHFLLFDEKLAYAAGLPARWLSLLLQALICLTISIGGLCAGPLAVFGFLVIPALTVLPFVRRMGHLYLYASAIGFFCAFTGFYLSYTLEEVNVPVTAAQILLLGFIWVLTRLGYLIWEH